MELILNQSELWLEKGQSAEVYVLALPAFHSDIVCQWSLSPADGIRILSQGKNQFGADSVRIVADMPQESVLTARYQQSRAVCRIHAADGKAAGNLQISGLVHTLHMEETHRLMAEGTVYWLSSDRDCVTVDREGILKAYRPGKVKIYCIRPESLSDALQYELWEMGAVRCVEAVPALRSRLEVILSQAVYAQIPIEVLEEEGGEKVLRFCRISEEAITQDSILVLWNRAALTDCGDFSCYEIICRAEHTEASAEKIRTTKLGITLTGLIPDTSYIITVRAVDTAGTCMAQCILHARTRQKSQTVIDVMQAPFGAVGDGCALDTAAIQKAIDACPEGGEVRLPAGYCFLSGALFLKSNMTLCIDGTLLGSSDPADYPLVVSRWEGWRKFDQPENEWANTSPRLRRNQRVYASLLNAGVYDEQENIWHLENLVLRGSGTVDANGFALSEAEGPCHYSEDGIEPVLPPDRADPSRRGSAIRLHNCRNVYVKDLTVQFAPGWTIHSIYCENVVFDHLHVVSRMPEPDGRCILNGDGIDPDSCINIVIFDCFFRTGDDAVAIKSGRNREGNQLNRPSAHIRVTDCISSGSKGGFCIGSEQAGGAHDILWQNLVVENVMLFGLWVKASAARGGLVTDVLWKDCELRDTGGCIFLEDGYRSIDANPAEVLPEICYQRFENIRCTGANGFGIQIKGLADGYIHDISFRDVRFEGSFTDVQDAFKAECAHNIVLEHVMLPEDCEWDTDQDSVIVEGGDCWDE